MTWITFVNSESVLTALEAGEEVLTPAERGRAAGFRDRRQRRDFLAAHLLVRHGVARLTGLAIRSVELRQQCPDCRSTGHGKPFLPQFPSWHVSLSHCRGTAAAAVSESPVGVDVESAHGFCLGPVEQRLLDRVLQPAESAAVRSAPQPAKAFLRQWVRKEALVKVGAGTLRELSGLDLSSLPLDWPGGGGTQASRALRYRGWHLLDWADEQRHVLGAAAAASGGLVVVPFAGDNRRQ